MARRLTVGDLRGMKQFTPRIQPNVNPLGRLNRSAPAEKREKKKCCRSGCAGCPWTEARLRKAE